MYAKMSIKGQVTIPKAIREEELKIAKEGGVLFLVEDGEVKLKGVPAEQAERLAGSLKAYSKKYVPLNEIREKIKGQIVDEAAGEGLSD
jgi:bifunctional DNA-binding transcriptional regulator/antitoxin component of YhaV-PrlF toxin-antitoxin module